MRQNTTLLSLFLFRSPVSFSLAASNSRNTYMLNKISLVFSTKPLLYSNFEQHMVEVKNSKFNSFLSHPIHIDSTNYRYQTKQIRSIDTEPTIDIDHSIFSECKTTDQQDGGAVFLSCLSSQVKITQTSFIGCFADRSGGALYTYCNTLLVSRCCFVNCFAVKRGNSFNTKTADSSNSHSFLLNVVLSCSGFNDKKTSSNTAVIESGRQSIENCNFSLNYAKESPSVAGLFATKYISLDSTMNMFSKSNGDFLLSLENGNDTSIYHNLFESSVTKTSALKFQKLKNSIIRDCCFINISSVICTIEDSVGFLFFGCVTDSVKSLIPSFPMNTHEIRVENRDKINAPHILGLGCYLRIAPPLEKFTVSKKIVSGIGVIIFGLITAAGFYVHYFKPRQPTIVPLSPVVDPSSEPVRFEQGANTGSSDHSSAGDEQPLV